jgi:hypothetical protein
MRPCLGCGTPAKVRRCTRQPLCSICRQKPQFLVVRRKEALSTGLSQRSLPAPFLATNRHDPRLAPELCWWWSDVAQACALAGLQLP